MTRNYIQEAKEELADLFDYEMEEDLLDLYALLVLTKGDKTSLQDVHDAWSIWQNRHDPDHKSLVRFFDLSPKVQEYDREYRDAIVEANRILLHKV